MQYSIYIVLRACIAILYNVLYGVFIITYLVFTGVPTLAQLKWHRKHNKRAELGGLQCKNMHELLPFSKQFALPASLSMLQAAPSTSLVNAVVPTALYVPMDAASYSVHGTCFTGKIQIGWIGQLIGWPKSSLSYMLMASTSCTTKTLSSSPSAPITCAGTLTTRR